MRVQDQFDEIWVVDFEFRAPDGSLPSPLCMVARELRSGNEIVLWGDELSAMKQAPFNVGPTSLVVAYYASAEIGCFLALGWLLPTHVLDLYAEFRCLSNGRRLPSGQGLLGAMVYFGLDCMGTAEKDGNRDLVMRGGPYSAGERLKVLQYCADDVDALGGLFEVMADRLTPQSMLRGRYMRAVASMESNGIPLDMDVLCRLQDHWSDVQDVLINRVDAPYGVYEGHTFKRTRFAGWLRREQIAWPLLDTGGLALDAETFRYMARIHPKVAPLHELRVTMGQMRRLGLTVGPDGRNRCMLSAFGSRTGRNQPSTTKSVFGPAAWFRGLIKPPLGNSLAYIDYGQQEFAVAASLSGDTAMQEAYLSGDPYLGFAKAAGAVPADATKVSHPSERELFKTVTLGVQYCMSEYGMAQRLGISVPEARRFLALHRSTFSTFWSWSDAAVDYAMLTGRIHTVFDWALHVGGDTKPRSLRNFPMQANGAEILRMACCLATERGIKVCMPVHDALLVEGPTSCMDDVVAETQRAMRGAGEIVLSGFTLNSDVKTVHYPDRYMDPRGEVMWGTIMNIMGGFDE